MLFYILPWGSCFVTSCLLDSYMVSPWPFQPGYILPCHRSKHLYSLTNKSNTYTKGPPTSHKQHKNSKGTLLLEIYFPYAKQGETGEISGANSYCKFGALTWMIFNKHVCEYSRGYSLGKIWLLSSASTAELGKQCMRRNSSPVKQRRKVVTSFLLFLDFSLLFEKVN